MPGMLRILFPVLTLFTVCLPGCRKKPPVKPDEPSKIEGISDHWVLIKVQQVDVDVRNPLNETDSLLDISADFFTGVPAELVFSKEGMVYAMLPGRGSAFFNKPGGSWKFDNDIYPKYVILNAGTPQETVYGLLQSIRPQDVNLVLKFNKNCSGRRTASYHLWFARK